MVVSSKFGNILIQTKYINRNIIQRYQSTVTATSKLLENTAVETDEYARAKPFSQMPTPKGWPILGNMLEFMKIENRINATAMYKRFVRELGPIFKIRLPGHDIVITSVADDGQTILSNDGRYPRIPSFELFERIRKGPLAHLYPTAGLLSGGKDWQEARSLVQQDMMRPKSALFYINDMNELMDDFVAKLEGMLDEDKKVDDLNRPLQEFALDAIGVMFIGNKLDVLQGSEYGKQMITKVSRLFELMLDVIAIPPKLAPYAPKFKEYVQLSADMYVMSREKINEAIKKHQKDGSLEGTILAKMIERCGPDSELPVVMANDALLAGIDTTGNTAGLIMYHLATNPDKQEKLYEEIVKIIGKDGKMTEEALAQMRYLKACQQESMRMTPVAIGTERAAGQDIVLSGYQVPKGTLIFRLGVLMSMDEKYFKNPDQFLPERWIRGCPQHEKLNNAYANLPFGHGPRACVGQRFARLELYMIMFKLIQKYKISYDGPELGVSYNGLGSTNGPLALKFEKRI